MLCSTHASQSTAWLTPRLVREPPPGLLVGPGAEHRQARLDAALEQPGERPEADVHALPVEEPAGEDEPKRLVGAPLGGRLDRHLARADLEMHGDLVAMALPAARAATARS